jgi:16S rRNA processing protein RimM
VPLLQNQGKKPSSKLSPNKPDLIQVGKIVGIHGLKGWLKFHVTTDFLERIEPGERLYLGGESYTIESLTFHKNRALIRLAGCSSREDCEHFVNLEVFAENRPINFEPDEYRVEDLIGMEAITPKGEHLGVVNDVIAAPAQDILVIDSWMMPMVQEFVKKIDLVARQITVEPIEGMVNL